MKSVFRDASLHGERVVESESCGFIPMSIKHKVAYTLRIQLYKCVQDDSETRKKVEHIFENDP